MPGVTGYWRPMNIKATTQYDKKLIGEAAFLFWRKSFIKPFIVSVGLLVLAVLNILLLNVRTWLSGTFLVIALLGCVLFVWAYFIYKKRSLRVFEQMGESGVDWRFSEEGFETESGAGSAAVKWSFVNRLIKSADVWLIVYKNDSYSVFPLKGVKPEVLDFIEKQVVRNGGKVI